MTACFAEFSGSGGRIATCPGRIASGASNNNAALVGSGTIVVRDLLFGVQLFKLRLGAHPAAVAFSPSGDRLVAVTRDRGGDVFIRVFDGKTGREINSKQLPSAGYDNISKVAFASDGSQIFIAGASDPRLRAFDGECRRELWSAAVCGSNVMALAVSPDGSEVVAVCMHRDGGGVIAAWSASSGAELRRVRVMLRLTVSFCALAPDARSFVVKFMFGSMTNIDACTGDELWRHEGSDDRLTPLAFSRDGRFVLCGSRSETGRGEDAVLLAHDAADGRIVGRVPVGTAPLGTRVTANGVATALAGRIVAVTLFDGSRALKFFSNFALNI